MLGRPGRGAGNHLLTEDRHGHTQKTRRRDLAAWGEGEVLILGAKEGRGAQKKSVSQKKGRAQTGGHAKQGRSQEERAERGEEERDRKA
jgi:hypothetical protein